MLEHYEFSEYLLQLAQISEEDNTCPDKEEIAQPKVERLNRWMDSIDQ